MSILPRTSVVAFCVLVLGCTEDQSKAVGNIPKQTIDRATTGVNKAMQQGADSRREADEKENK